MSLTYTSTIHQHEMMTTWSKRHKVDPKEDQQVGETATSLAQQPKATEMLKLDDE